MAATRADIATRADCERLVRAFYGRALDDPIIGWLFTDVARLDLEAHVPRITAFWETILLGAQSYNGGAFAPHAELHAKAQLRGGHFERWLWLWRATVGRAVHGRAGRARKGPCRTGRRSIPRPPQRAPKSLSAAGALGDDPRFEWRLSSETAALAHCVTAGG